MKKRASARPRLRFDKVATRLIERLKTTLGKTVPDGMTLLVTITAPIREPANTAATLEDKIRALLGRGSLRRVRKHTIHGNRVQIRFLTGVSARAPNVIVFVHNPETDPLQLLSMARLMVA